MDQPGSQRQDVMTAKGPSPAVVSLNREYLAVLSSEEASNLGRTVAQIVRGDGWRESKASAVLTDAIAGWLGRDVVKPVGFFANGDGPVEVLAQVGPWYISAFGIESPEDILVNCCQRHRGARFSQSRLDDFDHKQLGPRFVWGTPLAQRTADRLAVLFAQEVDPEIARVVLGG